MFCCLSFLKIKISEEVYHFWKCVKSNLNIPGEVPDIFTNFLSVSPLCLRMRTTILFKSIQQSIHPKKSLLYLVNIHFTHCHQLLKLSFHRPNYQLKHAIFCSRYPFLQKLFNKLFPSNCRNCSTSSDPPSGSRQFDLFLLRNKIKLIVKILVIV